LDELFIANSKFEGFGAARFFRATQIPIIAPINATTPIPPATAMMIIILFDFALLGSLD
jgi:hypothetical protein